MYASVFQKKKKEKHQTIPTIVRAELSFSLSLFIYLYLSIYIFDYFISIDIDRHSGVAMEEMLLLAFFLILFSAT